MTLASRGRGLDATVGASVALLAWIILITLHVDTSAGWRHEDGLHLDFALTHPWWSYFVNPKVAALQSYAHISPFNALWYDLNLALWGLNPQRWYLSLAGVMALCCGLVAVLCRDFLGLKWAVAAGLGLGFLPSSAAVVMSNMTGHYAQGLAFSLISALCFKSALAASRRDKVLWAGACILFYAMACLSKELYVLLPFVLFWMGPQYTLRNRISLLLPLMTIFVGYFVWRDHVLGSTIGGYTGKLQLAALVGNLPARLGQAFVGPDLPAWLLSLVLAVAMFLAISHQTGGLAGRFQALVRIGVIALLALAPLAGVSFGMSFAGNQMRLLLVVQLLSLILIVYALRIISQQSRVGSVLAACAYVGLLALVLQSTHWTSRLISQEAALNEATYDAILTEAKGTCILPPSVVSHDHYQNMARVRSTLNPQDPSGQPLLLKPEILTRRPAECQRTIAYQPDRRSYQPDEQQIESLIGQNRKAFEDGRGKPISVDFKTPFNGSIFRAQWHFGPSAHAGYVLISEPYNYPYLPPQGTAGFPTSDGLNNWKLRIVFQSPEGWSAITPVLAFTPIQDGRVQYSGPSSPDDLLQ